MNWIAIIAALMPLLLKLIEWLLSRQGKKLTDAQVRRVQRVLDRCARLQREAIACGCSQGNAADDTNRGKREGVGDLLLCLLAPALISAAAACVLLEVFTGGKDGF